MDTNKYLLEEQTLRQSHLKLDEDCIERGGSSTQHRGVLAQYLDTPIYGRPADLCHACHNAKCSNPHHLYWGTRKENILDAKADGTWKTVWERCVDKYGYDEACKRNARGDKAAGGKAGKGKILSESHKKKIAKSVKESYNK